MIYPLFFNKGEVCEIRAIGISGKNAAWEGFAKGTVSGYFDDPEALEKAAAGLDKAKARGVYFTINPVNPALLARAANRIKVPKSTTQDGDVTCARWLPIDLDPRRPSDISSTQEELHAAIDLAKEVAAWLEGEIGFAKGIRAESGNGCHLLYRLPDLPNDEESHKLLVAAVAAIQARFDNDRVDIDPVTINPSRIWKFYSTTGRKGDSTKDRPHRKSRLFPKQPTKIEDVPITPREILEKLAALAPSVAAPPATIPAAGATRFKESTLGPIKMAEYLDAHGIGYKIKQDGAQTLYCLDVGLCNPDHGDGQSSIITSPTGPVVYQCFHASCKGKFLWKDARKAISGDKPIAPWCAGFVEGWKPPKTVGTGMMKDIQVGTALPEVLAATVPAPEAMDPMEMFEKRGKRPVFVPMFMAKYLASYLGPIYHTSGIHWRYNKGLFSPFPETSLVQTIVQVMKDRAQGDMISNTLKILNGLINREEKYWPNEINLMCLQNGMLDIGTLQVIPHDPRYGARTQLNISYDHQKPAWSDRFWDWLKEMFPEDENYEKRGLLQQFSGYCLLRDCLYQVMMMMYGTGANGKSTFLECLQGVLGFDNTSSIPLEEIGQKFKGYFLQNKLVNISGEINQRTPMDTDFLKKVIGGDPVTVEAKYGNLFQFKPFCKFICALNEAPVIPDKTYGFARRLLVVNFERRLTPAEISDRLRKNGGKKMSEYLLEEKDGIFAWMLEGLKILLKNHGFRITDKIQEDTEQMMESLNPLLVFVNEMCEIQDQASVETMELFECYEQWCTAGHNRCLGRNNFLGQIRSTFPRVSRPKIKDETGKKRRVTIFNGIGLTQSAREWTAERKARFTKRQRED